MTKLNEIYKCEICGNIVEVLHTGAGELVCCGVPMVLQNENTVNAAIEKHVPIMEKIDKGVKISVGEVAHPMEDDHYIEWIEILTKDKVYKKFLKPGDASIAEFNIDFDDIITVREYCNLHGLWKA